MPVMEPVDSEGLVAVGYDPEKEQLYLRFLNSDDIYVYYECRKL